MRGSPDFAGTFGSAWRIHATKEQLEKLPAQTGTIAAFQVNRPNAHPFWSWWVVSIVHLRPIEGARPAALNYPEAEYEFQIISLDPSEPMPDPDGSTPDVPHAFLTPPDVIYQFHGVTDTQAVELCELMVKSIVLSGFSPDSDFRSRWIGVLQKTIEHMVLGGHPRGAVQ